MSAQLRRYRKLKWLAVGFGLMCSPAFAETCELTDIKLDHSAYEGGYALVQISADPSDAQRTITGSYSTVYYKYRDQYGRLRKGSAAVPYFTIVLDEGEESTIAELPFLAYEMHINGNRMQEIYSLRLGTVTCEY